MGGRYDLVNTDGSELGLSAELITELRSLVREFQATLNHDDPMNSYPSAPDYNQRVREAAVRVKQELGDEWIIRAQSIKPEDHYESIEVRP